MGSHLFFCLGYPGLPFSNRNLHEAAHKVGLVHPNWDTHNFQTNAFARNALWQVHNTTLKQLCTLNRSFSLGKGLNRCCSVNNIGKCEMNYLSDSFAWLCAISFLLMINTSSFWWSSWRIRLMIWDLSLIPFLWFFIVLLLFTVRSIILVADLTDSFFIDSRTLINGFFSFADKKLEMLIGKIEVFVKRFSFFSFFL